MTIEIQNYVETEDGGATFDLICDDVYKQRLIQEGFTSILKDKIQKELGYARDERGFEQVAFSFDPNGGWVEAIRQLCLYLSSAKRGEYRYFIPEKWVVRQLESDWLTDGMTALEQEYPDEFPS